MTDSDKNIIDDAVQQFINAKLQGQETDLNEFVKRYPGYEHQIRQKIEKIQRIDGLFSGLMEADDSDYSEPVAGHDLIGQKLGDFEILSLIGAGGMGAVFLARQISLDREVALKVISDISGARGKSLERFKREAKVLAKISHPNIVPIYEVGEQGPYSYFAMEHVQGVSLDKILTSIRNAPPEEKASSIMRRCLETKAGTCEDGTESTGVAEIDTDYIVTISNMIVSVASALDYAHEKGILHRDVKPSNIIIASDGTPRLVDFGLAKAETQQTVTVTGEFFGTPSYVSPEQIRKPDTVDCRSDVFSLAATYYECLTLHLPFAGNTINEILTNVISREAVPPKKYCPRLSTDFNTVLLHALEKAPEDRYQTASEFVVDIRNILEFKPITAKRPSITRRAYKTLRRSPLKVVVGCALILISVLGYFLLSNYMQERQRDRANDLQMIAARHYDLRNIREAIKYYEKALEIYPLSAESYYRIGECYSSLGLYKKSLESFNEVIKKDPNNVFAYCELGLTYSSLGRYEESVEILRDALEIDPNNVAANAAAYQLLANTYLLMGQSEEHYTAANKAIAIRADHPNQSDYGLIEDADGAIRKIIEHFKAVVKGDPNNLIAYYMLSYAYLKCEDYKQAVKVGEQAIKLKSNKHDLCIAYLILSCAYEGLGLYEEAISASKQAIRINPHYAKPYYSLGILYERMGRYEDAIESFKQSIDKYDLQIDALAYYEIGLAYDKLGRNAQAVEAFKQAINLDPNYTQLYIQINVFKKPDYPKAYCNQGIIYSRMGQYRDAVEAFKQACEHTLYRDHNRVTELAEAYSECGDFDKAIEYQEKALELADDDNVKAEYRKRIEVYKANKPWRE